MQKLIVRPTLRGKTKQGNDTWNHGIAKVMLVNCLLLVDLHCLQTVEVSDAQHWSSVGVQLLLG